MFIGGVNESFAAPDLSSYTVIHTMTFTGYTDKTNLTIGDATGTTAYETGNKKQQKLYNVTFPTDCDGWLALQGVYPDKGWWIRTGGLYSYKGNRSGAVTNLKAGYVVAFNCSQDASKVMTLTNASGDPDGAFTYEQSDDTYTYYATMTADGQVGFCGAKSVGYITSIVVYAPGTVIVQPTGKYTAVNGNERTVEFSGANLAWNTDGGDNYTLFTDADGNSVNKAEVTVSENTTYYVVSTNGTEKSEPLVFSIEAGTEISLPVPTYSLSGLGEGYTKTYSISCDTKDILLNPTVTYTYTFVPSGDGTSETDVTFDGTINSTESGTYTVTASAEGYTPSTLTIENAVEYELTKDINILDLNAASLSSNWKLLASSTSVPGSSSQWLAYFPDVVTDEYYYDFTSETALATDVIDGLSVEFDETGKTPKLYTGFGFMYPVHVLDSIGVEQKSPAITSGKIAIANGTADQYGVYHYMSGYNGKQATAVVAGDQAFSLYRFSNMLTRVEIYSPKNVTPSSTAAQKISEVKALADGTDVELTLSNAKLTFVGMGGSGYAAYIEDETGGIVIDNEIITALSEVATWMESGKLINGTIYAKYSVSNGMPTLAMNDDVEKNATSVTATTPDAAFTPTAITFADVKEANVARYVKLSDVELSGSLEEDLIASNGTDSITIVNKYFISVDSVPAKAQSVAGILVTDGNGSYSLYLISADDIVAAEEEPTPAPVDGYKTISETTVFLTTSANVAAAVTEGWAEGGKTTSNKSGSINPSTGEECEATKFEGIGVKSGNGDKTLTLKVTGVNSIVAYGVSTSSADTRILVVKATASDGTVVTQQAETAPSTTAVVTLSGLDASLGYTIDFTGVDANGKGADVAVQGVKFVVDSDIPTAINSIGTESALNGNVYTIGGTMVRKAGEKLNGLSKGIYIVNGKKVVVK